MNYTRMLVPSMVQNGIVLQDIIVLLHRCLVVAVEGCKRVLCGVHIAALDQCDNSVTPGLILGTPVGASHEIERSVVPVTLMHKRVEGPELLHGALVQRISHVDKCVVSTWAYPFDPATVNVFYSAPCAEDVMLHELRALSLRKAFSA